MNEAVKQLRGDSPKCLSCIEEGKIGQTYKIAGKAAFKCQSCGQITERESYAPEDFSWRYDDAWLIKAKSILETKKSKVGLQRLSKIEASVKEMRADRAFQRGV